VSPDRRQHRGAHPADRELFSETQLPRLRLAVADLAWLLTRDYAPKAALKLVGDKFGLKERQRLALARAACSNQSLAKRSAHRVSVETITGENIIVDGFNLIITIEAALSTGVLLFCGDQCIRDLSSVHGSYRAVSETEAAIVLIGEELEKLSARSVEWLLDQPISNSGRLAKLMREIAVTHHWPWKIDLLFNPDERIISSNKIAITSDSVILDRVTRWANFSRHIIEKRLPDAWIADLESQEADIARL
jgi:hypothetical protein